MPFVTNRGQRIHYTVDGVGPLVILLHGLLLDAASWRSAGFVGALAKGFRVVCIDSLGHGRSDKPSDPALYSQAQRAGDIVAVMDELGSDRASLIGHSMGGWLTVGVAKFHPHRISSMIVGGWDLLNGVPRTPAGPLTFDAFMAFARRTAPKLVEWVSPRFESGIRACFSALDQLDGARQAVLSLPVPVMIWSGRSDSSYAAMSAFAAENGLQFLSTPGDHLGMVFHHGAAAAKRFATFIR